MKIIFWAVTVLGLLPLTAFAILHLSFRIAMHRQLAKDAEFSDGETTFLGSSTIQMGESMTPMVVSPHAWPGVVVLIGVATCFFGLFFLIPRQPIRVAENGYSRFEPLIERLVSSRAEYSSLIVSAREGNEAFLLMRSDSGISISLSTDSTQRDRIDAIKSYFSSHGYDSPEEYSTHDDHFDTDTTHLDYELNAKSADVSQVCIGLFRDVFGVQSDEPIEFAIEP